MRACPPNLRRRIATALLSLVTLAGAGTLSAQADNGNGQDISDLAITKSAEKSGSSVTYRLEVTNNGPRPGTQVNILDKLPAGVIVSSATVTEGAKPSDDCTVSTDVSTGRDVVDCDIHGEIDPTVPQPPQTGRPKVVVTIVATIRVDGEVCNRATVSGNHQDPDETNNISGERSACTTIGEPPVPPRADLSIEKLVDKSVALVGEDLTYTITVTNNGPSAATNVVVTDDIPSEAALQPLTPPCSTPVANQPRHVVCNLGSLASGTSAAVMIKVKAATKGLHITNTARVTSDQEDPETSNNADSAITNAFASLEGSGAFGELINVKTILGLHVQSGPLASVTLPAGGGGPISDSAVKAYVTGGFLLKDLVRLEALKGTTQGGKTANGDNVYVNSSADVATASLVNGLITVEKLHSECYASSATTGKSSANIVKLRVLGAEVKVAAGPNSKIVVPGVGELILNEQVNDLQGPFLQTRTVNALHLKLYGPLAYGDVILAQSKCRIDP